MHIGNRGHGFWHMVVTAHFSIVISLSLVCRRQNKIDSVFLDKTYGHMLFTLITGQLRHVLKALLYNQFASLI